MPPPVVMAIAVFLMWTLAKAIPALDFEMPTRAVGIALVAGGLAIAVGAFLQFRRTRTTINPMTPHESSALVRSGVYRWSRNPIYVADALILVGCASLIANALAFVLVALFVVYVDRFQIRAEERALRERFGPQFDEYCRRVRRWL